MHYIGKVENGYGGVLEITIERDQFGIRIYRAYNPQTGKELL